MDSPRIVKEPHLETLTLHHSPPEPALGVPVARAPERSAHLITRALGNGRRHMRCK